MNIPLTERSNTITRDIDVDTSIGILKKLRQSDAQMFTGFESFDSLLDADFLNEMERLVGLVHTRGVSEEKPLLICFSGAGTSGRIAAMCSATFNDYLMEKGLSDYIICTYLIAGGDCALIKAQENAEDDGTTAIDDIKMLRSRLDEYHTFLYVGITCGLSATYVASQLHFLANDERAIKALIGFSPISLARDTYIDCHDLTIKDILMNLDNNDPMFVPLTPVVGPEPITGSTRMKGGSATKIILETVFHCVLNPVLNVRDCILKYADAMYAAYSQNTLLGEIIDSVVTALRYGGRLVYLGSGLSGCVGVIDASECPPTYGARFDTVRGFIEEGFDFFTSAHPEFESQEQASQHWNKIKNSGYYYRIDLSEFTNVVIHNLSSRDVVLFVGFQSLSQEVLSIKTRLEEMEALHYSIMLVNDEHKRRLKSFKNALNGMVPFEAIQVTSPDNGMSLGETSIQLEAAMDLPSETIVYSLKEFGLDKNTSELSAFALKLILNAITTAGHIQSGKVFHNLMVDLRISNKKLFHRAIGIISKIAKLEEKESRRCLLESIYRRTDFPNDLSVENYVEAASGVESIVPIALLRASNLFTLEEAMEVLRKEPIVRQALIRSLNQSGYQ
ncbi:hypothetical protein PCE1_000925 [Barthelona sp. PCE]